MAEPRRGAVAASAPAVTVVVATRGRGDSVVRTLRSVGTNRSVPYEVVVLDQSADEATATAVTPHLVDARIRYVRSTSVGLARARNLAIATATTELIGLTDDDCEVPPDWLDGLLDAFATDARIGVVFGNVMPAEHDRRAGFVPSYVRATPFLARSPRDKAGSDGMGACMALRRSLWERLGGFDERFGAGARFRAADEGELAMRALAAGWLVYETPALRVVHHGFRDRGAGRELVHAYTYGAGAMMATHLRRRTPQAGRLLATMAWRWASGRVHDAVRLGGGRHRVLRLRAFTQGFVAGVVASDRRTS